MLDRGQPLRRANAPLLKNWAEQGRHLVHATARGLSWRHRQLTKLSGLATPLQDLKHRKVALAHSMARGHFAFGEQTYSGIPAHIFKHATNHAEWLRSLQDLSWLSHFTASDNELHRILARTMLLNWHQSISMGGSSAQWPKALMALSRAAPYLLGKRPSPFQAPLLAMTEKLLGRVLSLRCRDLDPQLLQAISLQYAALAFRSDPQLLGIAQEKFRTLIDKVILPDGGHSSRCPTRLLSLMMDLVPLKNAYVASNLAVPHSLTAAIERGFPMLRLLAHGDQTLAHFQGCGAIETQDLKALLDCDDSRGKPLSLAPHSGYARLAHKQGTLIMDVGAPLHCDSALAFEFSDGAQRLFINCGHPAQAPLAWQRAAADVAAHNTLEFEAVSHPHYTTCEAELLNSPKGSLIAASRTVQAGYATYTHQRQIFLAKSGRDLRGEDQVQISSGDANVHQSSTDIVMRFHLHPAIRASLVRTGQKIVLLLPNRSAWHFTLTGATLDLEESFYLAGEEGNRKTAQITARAKLKTGDKIKWALQRVEKTNPSNDHTMSEPELPF